MMLPLLPASTLSVSATTLIKQCVPPSMHWKLDILEGWKELVGHFSSFIHIQMIKDDVLILKAIHPAWAQEFAFFTHELKNKINKLVGSGRISRILFAL